MSRTRKLVPDHLLQNARPKPVTKVPLAMVVLELSLAEARRRPEGSEILGPLWEAMWHQVNHEDRGPLLQRNGTRIEKLRAHAESLQICEPSCQDWPCREPATPKDEVDEALAERWLFDELDKLADRDREIVANGLGLHGNARSPKDMSIRLGITDERVRQILREQVEALRRAWRANMVDAALALERGPVERVEIPSAPGPFARSPAAAPGPKRAKQFSPAMLVSSADGGMRVDGILVRRIDHEAYTLAGGTTRLNADEVAAALRGVMAYDARNVGRMIKAVSRRDSAIGDALRWMHDGPCWPTAASKRVLLPLGQD